jgi:hypothetical protein
MSRMNTSKEQSKTSSEAAGASTQPASRRAYEKPSLQVYGDLTEITQSMRFFGKNDGGSHPNRHYTR